MAGTAFYKSLTHCCIYDYIPLISPAGLLGIKNWAASLQKPCVSSFIVIRYQIGEFLKVSQSISQN